MTRAHQTGSIRSLVLALTFISVSSVLLYLLATTSTTALKSDCQSLLPVHDCQYGVGP